MAISNLIWWDGRACPAEEFRVHPAAEGLLYGQGVFETTRTVAGMPFLWKAHLDRLARSSAVAGINLENVTLPTEEDVRAFVDALGEGDVAVRLNVAAIGAGGRESTWMFARKISVLNRPIRLAVERARLIGMDDAWANHKTFQYLTRHLAYRSALAKGFDDAVMLSPADEVLETAHANIFVRFEDEWWTPSVEEGVLPGTLRGLMVAEKRLAIRVSPITLDELMDADEVVISNSVRGVVSVSEIDGRSFAITAEGERLVDWARRSMEC
jgi:branched-subunit amino acid aminotransferase/4-amino-4-deoxychorismate lyase